MTDAHNSDQLKENQTNNPIATQKVLEIADRLEQCYEKVEQFLKSENYHSAYKQIKSEPWKDASNILCRFNSTYAKALLSEFNIEDLVAILESSERTQLEQIIENVDEDDLAAALNSTSPDVTADVLRVVDWEKAKEILMKMRSNTVISKLLLYQDEDAGGLMNPDVVALYPHWSVSTALNQVRSSSVNPQKITELYVVTHENELVGRISLGELIKAKPGIRIKSIMRSILASVTTAEDQEKAAELAVRYSLLSIPVVDESNRLQGAIALDELSFVQQAEATEDILRSAGLSGAETLTSPILKSLTSRLPWLMVNILTTIIVAVIFFLFESSINAVTLLAVHVPMIMNQSGIIGTQITTLLVRSMTLGQVGKNTMLKILIREYKIAFISAVPVSVVLSLIVGVWRQSLELGLVILASMFISYFFATTAGVAIPIYMRRFKIDPATASGVILTTVTDAIGSVVFFAIASIYLVGN